MPSESLTPQDQALVEAIAANHKAKQPTTTTLGTDERVLARVSDGIYRQPASALRELLANAYDADASEVTVQTDAPRFESISVRDDGHGMSTEALVRMIKHIGGSAKRTKAGQEIGITNKHDPSLSPGGRKLIGKIGIGLFSVSQLTRRFRVITKEKGSDHRLVADVVLRTYSEDEDPSDKKDAKKFEGGTVTIQVAEAKDPATHGTEVLLFDLQPAAKDMLRSKEVWDRVGGPQDESSQYHEQTIQPPTYHLGRVDPKSDNIVLDSAQLPWKTEDAPDARFHKLVAAVAEESGKRTAKPSIAVTLDRYLQSIWNLSLALPLAYIESHPFDLTSEDDPRTFELSNAAKGQSTEIKRAKKQSLREALKLTYPPPKESASDFVVLFDNIRLARPLRFNGLPSTDLKNASKTPLLFVGKFKADLSKIPGEVSGGRELDFEAYFLWSPRIVPTEHNGVLVRMANASGTLFDPSFFGYQVAELTRLAQISGEIFVKRGLDAALNIDRESFNFGHPHAKMLTTWVHRALRQITNTQKRISKLARDARRETTKTSGRGLIAKIVEEELEIANVENPTEAQWFEDKEGQASARKAGKIVLDRESILAKLPPPRNSQASKQERNLFEDKLVAVAQILDAYGLLDRLDFKEQQRLIHAIARIFVEQP